MKNPSEALEVILASLSPVTGEKISLFSAKGRVISAPCVSQRTIPPGNSSTLDGYAVKKSDLLNGLPVKLRVNGVIAAGDDTRLLKTPAGTCWRIMTGAILPPDSDFIIRHEDTDNSFTEVTIRTANLERSGVRQEGEEAAAGEMIDHTGTRLSMAHLAELTARGAHYISVYRKPRVAVLASGNEVVDPSVQNMPHKIFDTNSVAIKSILEEVGCDVNYLGVFGDKADILAETLAGLKGYDLIISSGGVSAGDFDYFARAPEKLGVEWTIFHVRQRPAQPICYGKANGTPFFALPGTPVGAVLCALFYVKPAAKRLAGYKYPEISPLSAILSAPVDKRVECVQYNMALCTMENGVLMASPKPLANYSLKTLASSNAFLRIDSGSAGTVEAGTPVDAYLFDPSTFL